MRIEDMISAVQKSLGVDVDGKAGPQTWTAVYERIVNEGRTRPRPTPVIDPVDPRSEKCLATLLPEVQPYARALVHQAAQVGIRIKIISGLRSYAEQDALYARGRTAPGPVVTNARAGHSNHNFGIAFDVAVFEGSAYLRKSPKYKAVGALGMALGLEWGGAWTTLVDEPHFQLRPAWAADLTERQMLAQLRTRMASEEPVYA